MIRARYASWTIVAFAMASNGVARADEPRPPAAAVLSLHSDDADVQADALTSALRSEVRASKRFELVEASRSLAMLSAAFGCASPPDAACQRRIGDHLKLDTYFWGYVAKSSPDRVTAEVHLYRKGRPDAVARETYALAEGERALAQRILDKLAPGAAPEPAKPPPAAIAQPPAREPPTLPVEPQPRDRFPTGKVVGAGLVVVGIGLGALSVERFMKRGDLQDEVDGLSGQINDTNGQRRSPCSVSGPAAASACRKNDEAVSASVIGIVAAAGSVVAIGSGVVLFLMDSNDDRQRSGRSPLRVAPGLGPSSASVSIKGSF